MARPREAPQNANTYALMGWISLSLGLLSLALIAFRMLAPGGRVNRFEIEPIFLLAMGGSFLIRARLRRRGIPDVPAWKFPRLATLVTDEERRSLWSVFVLQLIAVAVAFFILAADLFYP